MHVASRRRGHARRGRRRAVPLRPQLRGQRRAAQRAHRRADPAGQASGDRRGPARRQGSPRTRPRLIVSMVVGSAAPATCRRSSTSSSERRPRRRSTSEVAEVRSAVAAHRRPAGTASPPRSPTPPASRSNLKVIVDPSVLGGLVATVGDTVIDGTVRTRLDQLKSRSSRHTEQEPAMAELTISTSDIAAALQEEPRGLRARRVEATHGRARHSRSATASPACRGLPDCRRQRAARVRGRHGRPRAEPRRGVDRRRRARRGRSQHRGGPDGEGHRPHPLGARRRRPARPRRQRARRADRRQGPLVGVDQPPHGDPGARHHGPQARARAAADRHQGDRRDDPDRPRPARARSSATARPARPRSPSTRSSTSRVWA